MTVPSLFGESDSQEGSSASAVEPDSSSVASSSAHAATASLYRKYRPQSFGADELVGQEHVVRTLRNAISLGRVAHAYLFSGPRGTGKTTTARLLAKGVNCLHEDPSQRPCNICANCEAINAGATSDIIEIDAASNRGIDDIRDLRERVRYAPTQLPSKVYIIDEAHQITGAAANAFLKTLEEPPTHTRFILATTDPEELLPTIVSRCQRFEFRRVSADDITRRLRTVADIEGIDVDDDALRVIARHATGSLRDALGLLEQLALRAGGSSGAAAIATLDASDVRDALGLSRNDRVESLVAAIGQRDTGAALRIVQGAVDAGEDARQLNRQLLSYLRLLMVEKTGGSADGDDQSRALAEAFSLAELAALARRFGEIDFSIKHAPFPQLPLEIALVEATAAPETARTSKPDGLQPDSAVTPRPMPLRERVRGPASIREVSPDEHVRPSRPEPTPITPLRPRPAAASSNSAGRVGSGSADPGVEQIAELWPNVRADVKALNRRIEALLSEVDPVAISGNQITLAVPYPFHRDKLNTAEVRETVAGVLSRLLDREISLVCILRGEVAGLEREPQESRDTAAPTNNEQTVAGSNEEERARARLRAAINIFDAEEIDPASTSSQPTSSENG